MTQKLYEFTATIQASEVGKGGAFVIFPYDVRAEFGAGRAKVNVTFDGVPYTGSVVNMGLKNPDGSICYIIGVRKDIRQKVGKNIGDELAVTVQAVAVAPEATPTTPTSKKPDLKTK